MLTRIRRVDVARLAGFSSVLGIDLDDTSARIVPVRKCGSLFDKFKASFSADAPLTCNFPPSATAEAKGEIITEALSARRIKTRYCVAAIRSPGVRTVSAAVPASVQEIGEWIGEHAAKILKVPIPLSELEVRWRILETAPSGSIVEVTFVRITDLKEMHGVLNAAGLTTLGLSAGPADVLNSLFLNEQDIGEKDITVAYVEGPKVTLLPLAHARRKPAVIFPGGLDEATRKHMEGGELLWAGARSFGDVYPQDKELKPYNLTPDYALATGLALKGFLPELNPVDILSPTEREDNTVALWRSGFKRSAVVLGSILFLLLILQAAASYVLERISDQVEDAMSSSQGAVAEVASLRERVNGLEAHVKGSRSSASGGNLSLVLHQLACSVPSSVRIDRLQSQTDRANTVRLSLSLSARSREAVTAFMKAVEQAHFVDVTLVRLSAASGRENTAALVTAEVEATANPEMLL